MAVLEAAKRGYKVEKNGEVFAPNGKRLVAPVDPSKGYRRFTIRCDGKFLAVRVHKLVAFQKFGSAAFRKGIEVRHLDGNRINNTWSNIAIGTPHENQMDKPSSVRRAVALNAASKLRKLTESELRRFRSLREQGWTYKELGKEFGLSKSTISYIVNRKTYSGA